MAFFSISKLHLQPNMSLPDLIHTDSPSPVPSIPSLRRENLPNSMDFNPFATNPSIVSSADDSLPFEVDSFSDIDSDSERDLNCFVTDLFENRRFTDHLHGLCEHDRGQASGPDPFTYSANDLGISGFEDGGEIESNYIEELWSTFAVDSDSRVSEVDVSMQVADSINSGLRIVDVDSDSDSDTDNGVIGALELVTRDDRESDVSWVENPNSFTDNFNFCFHQRISYEDFEWEEVEERVDEMEIPSLVVDGVEELSLASGFSTDEESREEAGRWEILLIMNDIGRNTNWERENEAEVIADLEDYMYAVDYDTLFGQYVENDYTLKGSPPAAKTAVEDLPLVELKTEEVVVCAVCKDKFSMEEKVRKLPCCHYYHDDCIMPWLNIRNTCPVCRYELPTDDPDYERRRSQSASGGLQADLQVRYNLELIA